MGEEAGGVLRAAGGRLRLGWRLLAFFVLALVSMVCVAIVLPAGIAATSVAMLVGGVLAGGVLLAADGRGPGALGFYLRPAAPAESLRGLALGVAVGLLVVAVMAALGGLRWTFGGGSLLAWGQGAVTALLFLALPAAAEEAVLRGYPLQALAEAWGPAWALGITSVSFGALHLGNPGVTGLALANVAVAGLFLGVVYLKTGSLWFATGAHLGWNWAHGYLADVPVSGLELLDAPFYDGVPGGPEWLGGGGFGPEGSVVATVVVVGVSVACWRSGRLLPGKDALDARPLAVVTSAGWEVDIGAPVNEGSIA